MEEKKTYRRCLNCGWEWKPKKKNSKWCPMCHSEKYKRIYEPLPEFVKLREKLKHIYPYRKFWGKLFKSLK